MSLALNFNTMPNGLTVKTYGIGSFKGTVLVGDYEISFEDFLSAAHYVLTNTDLDGENDPRLQFVESIKVMKSVPGWMEGSQRLHTDVDPIPPLAGDQHVEA